MIPAIRSMTNRRAENSHDYCRLCGEADELDEKEYVLCNFPCLQNQRMKWLRTSFPRELDNITIKPLEEVLGFIKRLK